MRHDDDLYESLDAHEDEPEERNIFDSLFDDPYEEYDEEYDEDEPEEHPLKSRAARKRNRYRGDE